MTALIDCHIITIPSTNPAWLEQCIASVQHPSVAVHIVNGVVGNVGFGRAMGFMQGSADFVTFIDPDDWAEPSAFDRIIKSLGENGLCTAEYIRTDDGVEHVRGIDRDSEVTHANHYKPHHFLVLPRKSVTPHVAGLAAVSFMANKWIMEKVTASMVGSIPFLDEPFYNWRIHPNQYHLSYGKA